MYMHSPSLGRHNCVCLCRETAISDARAMRKAGKALSPASRTAQGLDLAPEHQVLLAGCASVMYVYTYMHVYMCWLAFVLTGRFVVSCTHLQWVATGRMHQTGCITGCIASGARRPTWPAICCVLRTTLRLLKPAK